MKRIISIVLLCLGCGLSVVWLVARVAQSQRRPQPPPQRGLIKPEMSDTERVNVYADNWFMMYINGKPVAIDSIDFLPHNVVSVDILPEYPMTIAVLARAPRAILLRIPRDDNARAVFRPAESERGQCDVIE